MPNTDAPFDAGVSNAFLTEARNFLSAEYLPKIERCLETLTDEQIWWRANETSNSIGNLLLHLSGNVRQWIVSGLGRQPDDRQRQSEFANRSVITKADLLESLKASLNEADKVLREFDPALIETHYRIQACDVSALAAIFHVVEHFSMHTGQIILLTKLLTGTDLSFYDFSTGVPLHGWDIPSNR